MDPSRRRREAVDAWTATAARPLGLLFLSAALVRFAMTGQATLEIIVPGLLLAGYWRAAEFFRVLRFPPPPPEEGP